MSNKAIERKKSTPLVTQPGRGDGPVIQGFAPDRFITADVLTVAPGTAWAVAVDTTFDYGGGEAFPVLAGERMVIPNGVEMLVLGAATLTAFAGLALPGAPTVITQQPRSAGENLVTDAGAIVLVGFQPSDISVVATGEAPLTYQWLRNGEPVAGQVAATLAGTGRDLESGHYSCVVTGPNGVKTSATIEVVTLDGEFNFTIGSQDRVGHLEYGFRSSAPGFDRYGDIDPNAWPVLINGVIENEKWAVLHTASPTATQVRVQGRDNSQWLGADSVELHDLGATLPDATLPWVPGSESYDVDSLPLADAIRANVSATFTLVFTPVFA